MMEVMIASANSAGSPVGLLDARCVAGFRHLARVDQPGLVGPSRSGCASGGLRPLPPDPTQIAGPRGGDGSGRLSAMGAIFASYSIFKE